MVVIAKIHQDKSIELLLSCQELVIPKKLNLHFVILSYCPFQTAIQNYLFTIIILDFMVDFVRACFELVVF